MVIAVVTGNRENLQVLQYILSNIRDQYQEDVVRITKSKTEYAATHVKIKLAVIGKGYITNVILSALECERNIPQF